MNPSEEVVIVGGSLSGLTLALACANRGVRTNVLERANGQQRAGAALGIDRALLMRTIGMAPSASGHEDGFPVLTEDRKATSWSALHGWLREQAHRRSEITLMEGRSVWKVTQSEAAVAVNIADGEQVMASVVIGADGYRSVVRAAVSPATPHAVYAGYVLWRGLIEEQEMPTSTAWPHDDKGVALVNTNGYRLVAYPVAGADGSLEPGRRQISFAWYDPTRTALLKNSRCVSRTHHVLGSLPSGSVPDAVRAELRELAQRIWPEPWCQFIMHALERRKVFATPVAEYCPEKLQNGRLAILGDAAHVVSPMTGKGFLTGTLDAGALAGFLAQADLRSYESISSALDHYEDGRLHEAQELAATSKNWSRAYLTDVGFRRSGQSWPLRSL